MSDIRVIVGKVPKLLGEIITSAFVSENAMSVIGEARGDDELVGLCERTQPNVIVMGMIDENTEAVAHRLLTRCPLAKIVAFASEGRNTFLFELRPHKVELGMLSSDDLVRLVRRMFVPAPKTTGVNS